MKPAPWVLIAPVVDVSTIPSCAASMPPVLVTVIGPVLVFAITPTLAVTNPAVVIETAPSTPRAKMPAPPALLTWPTVLIVMVPGPLVTAWMPSTNPVTEAAGAIRILPVAELATIPKVCPKIVLVPEIVTFPVPPV